MIVAQKELLAANQRRLRVAAGLSQAELAAEAGITSTTVAAIEQARANPRLDTLAGIAGVLRVDVADLLSAPEGPAVEVVRAGTGALVDLGGASGQELAGGALSVHVPPGRDLELPARPDAWRFVLVLDGRLITGPVETPTELDESDSAGFPASTPTLLRTGRRRARAVVLTMNG